MVNPENARENSFCNGLWIASPSREVAAAGWLSVRCIS